MALRVGSPKLQIKTRFSALPPVVWSQAEASVALIYPGFETRLWGFCLHPDISDVNVSFCPLTLDYPQTGTIFSQESVHSLTFSPSHPPVLPERQNNTRIETFVCLRQKKKCLVKPKQCRRFFGKIRYMRFVLFLKTNIYI